MLSKLQTRLQTKLQVMLALLLVALGAAACGGDGDTPAPPEATVPVASPTPRFPPTWTPEPTDTPAPVVTTVMPASVCSARSSLIPINTLSDTGAYAGERGATFDFRGPCERGSDENRAKTSASVSGRE